MSLIDSARDFVKGLVPSGPEVGEPDLPTGPGVPADVVTDEVADGLDDEVERMRREWDSQPSHH